MQADGKISKQQVRLLVGSSRTGVYGYTYEPTIDPAAIYAQLLAMEMTWQTTCSLDFQSLKNTVSSIILHWIMSTKSRSVELLIGDRRRV